MHLVGFIIRIYINFLVSFTTDFRLEVEENSALLGHYTESSGNSFPDFRALKMGPIGCPETSVRNYHYSLCNDPEGRSSPAVCRFISECSTR